MTAPRIGSAPKPSSPRGKGGSASLEILRGRGAGARHRGLIGGPALAPLLGETPKILAACCAPAGATGLGTAWFVNDFAQYESAMRQGAEQAGWLVRDPFTAEPHTAAFMFPLYVGIGKLAFMLQLSASAIEHVVEGLARALLVVALWRVFGVSPPGVYAAPWGV